MTHKIQMKPQYRIIAKLQTILTRILKKNQNLQTIPKIQIIQVT